MSGTPCFACKNPNCKRVKCNYDTVVIRVPLFNDQTILIKGILNLYDQTVVVKHNNTDYVFYANNRGYLKYRLRQMTDEQKRYIFLYSGIARVECCNERSISTLNGIYARVLVKASSFYTRKARKMEDITPLHIKILKKPMTYEERMEKWYNDMDAVRSMLLNKV